MDKYVAPLITGTLVGVAYWLLDTAFFALNAASTTLAGALLTDVSILRLSVRLLVLLIGVFLGGLKTYSGMYNARAVFDWDQPFAGPTVQTPTVRTEKAYTNRKTVGHQLIERPATGTDGQIERICKRSRAELQERFVSKVALGNNQLVWQYAGQLGQMIGLTADELEALRGLCYCHDIGKFAVNEELEDMHPEISAQIVEDIPEFAMAADAIRMHHERYDGSGLHGLSGEQIPLLSRVFSVAWVFNALTKPDGGYRLEFDEALQMLMAYAGTALDPELVEVFVERMNRGKVFVDSPFAQTLFGR